MTGKFATATGLPALCIFVFFCAAAAQAKPKTSITLNIPFEFALGNRMLPAGTYELEALFGPPTEADHMNILALRSIDGRLYQAVVTEVVDGQANPNSRLVFAYFHGQRFLSQVWLAGQHIGLKIHHRGSAGGLVEEQEKNEIVELDPPNN